MECVAGVNLRTIFTSGSLEMARASLAVERVALLVGQKHGEVAEAALGLTDEEYAEITELIYADWRLEVLHYISTGLTPTEAGELALLSVFVAGAALRKAIEDGFPGQ